MFTYFLIHGIHYPSTASGHFTSGSSLLTSLLFVSAENPGTFDFGELDWLVLFVGAGIDR